MNNKTVLLVEDNATLLESIAFELEMRDYNILQATNGVEALNVLKQANTPPDIIVSDIAMPDMDGYELLESVRKQPEWGMIPFLFLTAFDSHGAIRLGKELGVDDYLTKPFDPEDLVVAIESKLKRFTTMRSTLEIEIQSKKKQLINLISHELRTPLTSIYNSSKLLEYLLEKMPDEQVQDILAILDSGTQRMNRLVNRIVLYTQITAGDFSDTIKKKGKVLDLNKQVEAVVSEYHENNPNLEVIIQLKLADDPIPVSSIYVFLNAMIEELLDNAVKYSGANGVVTLTTQVEAGQAVLFVEDHGRGISPEHLSTIWEPFQQANREQHEQQGIGIGLSIVRDCVQAHGGRCDITSEETMGTTTTLRLPLG